MPNFKCNVCGRFFPRRSTLTQHMRTHTAPIRPYVCSKCQRGFSTSSNLIRHIRTHPSERPHVCPECQQGFIHDSNMRRHMQRTHPPESDFDFDSVWQDDGGVTITIHTHRIEHSNDSTTTVSTLASPLGTAVVTTTRSTRSPITTTAFSQPSGTFAVTDSDHMPERDHGNECSICFELFSSAETIVTPCDHKFHEACLSKLKRLNDGQLFCPLCRRKLE